MERFNLKKLNKEAKEGCRFEVSNRFAALEYLDAEMEINSAWETIRENIQISAKESLGYFELKKHKPRFNEGCSKLLEQRKEAKLQCLQDPHEINGDNLNNVRSVARRHLSNQKKEYLKDKINELATYSKNKNIRDLYRGINKFKRGCQSRNNLAKDENSDLLADSHNILNKRKDYFSLLLNVHNISDVRQISTYSTYGNSYYKAGKYKSPESCQIPAGLIRALDEKLLSAIHKLVNSIWNKEELPNQWTECVTVSVHKKGDLMIIVGYHCYRLDTKFD
jgi:hypothetical protein